jgi:HAE1 family hydrophobic/amphiphilic exporter-1
VHLEREARAILAELGLPAGVSVVFAGETEERDRSYASLWQALKWAALLIYCIIAVQFNSLRQPVIVLLAAPVALVGVTLGLLATGTPFSFMVFIGIVSLTGIVVNDGIVMIDATNRQRRAGMPLRDAVQAAAEERFRPVVLTTVTTIAGLLPLTLNVAEGSEFWVPLGVAIISGLLAASVLTLFLVPALYLTLEGPHWRRGARRLARGARAEHPAAPPGGALPSRGGAAR